MCFLTVFWCIKICIYLLFVELHTYEKPYHWFVLKVRFLNVVDVPTEHLQHKVQRNVKIYFAIYSIFSFLYFHNSLWDLKEDKGQLLPKHPEIEDYTGHFLPQQLFLRFFIEGSHFAVRSHFVQKGNKVCCFVFVVLFRGI